MFACAITGRVVGGGELETNFIYDEARPFEVRLQSVTGEDMVFDRDLLGEAFSQGASGIGWIRLATTVGRFLIRFGYDNGLFLSYPLESVHRFHKATYDLVPWGSEVMDLDSLLEDFYNDKI